MVDVKQVNIAEEKFNICDLVLHALPSWFG